MYSKTLKMKGVCISLPELVLLGPFLRIPLPSMTMVDWLEVMVSMKGLEGMEILEN